MKYAIYESLMIPTPKMENLAEVDKSDSIMLSDYERDEQVFEFLDTNRNLKLYSSDDKLKTVSRCRMYRANTGPADCFWGKLTRNRNPTILFSVCLYRDESGALPQLKNVPSLLHRAKKPCWASFFVYTMTSNNRVPGLVKFRAFTPSFAEFEIVDSRPFVINEDVEEIRVELAASSDEEEKIKTKRARSSQLDDPAEENPSRKMTKPSWATRLESWHPDQDSVPQKALVPEAPPEIFQGNNRFPQSLRDKATDLLKMGATIKFPLGATKEAAIAAAIDFEKKIFGESSPFEYLETTMDRLSFLFGSTLVDLQTQANVLEVKLIAMRAEEGSLDKRLQEKVVLLQNTRPAEHEPTPASTPPQERFYPGDVVFIRAKDAGFQLPEGIYVNGVVVSISVAQVDAPPSIVVRLRQVETPVTFNTSLPPHTCLAKRHTSNVEWMDGEACWVFCSLRKDDPSKLCHAWTKANIVNKVDDQRCVVRTLETPRRQWTVDKKMVRKF